MTKICFLLLCHKDPAAVINQVNYLTQTGGYVVIHMDKGAPEAYHQALHKEFGDNPDVRFAWPVKAGWGDWSLVSATLRMIDIALDEFADATNFYYLSGDCVPIRSHEELQDVIGRQKLDYIETSEFYNGGWIKTGPHIERIRFYHFINERKYKPIFYWSYGVQRMMNIDRKPPEGVVMSIGSQWWCLRRRTLERMRVYLRARPDVIRFFKWCWIPDEIFFQSLVATLVPENERKNKPPTFLRFSDYGLPTVFYDDHFSFLTAQEEFFARKVSPNAKRLKKRLIQRFIEPSRGEPVVSTGRNTIGFNVYAGRNGMRFGPSVWARGNRMPSDSRLFVVISKKWHVGKDFGRRLAEVTGIKYFGYVFDEESEDVGDLGGFQYDRDKRLEMPVAFMRMFYDTKNLNQAIIGADPSRYKELLQLTQSGEDIRAIELENQFSPEYLDGHAERSGLMVQQSSSVQEAALHRTILEIFRNESQEIKGLEFTRFGHIRDWHNAKTRAEILGAIFEQETEKFLDMVRDVDIRD